MTPGNEHKEKLCTCINENCYINARLSFHLYMTVNIMRQGYLRNNISEKEELNNDQKPVQSEPKFKPKTRW